MRDRVEDNVVSMQVGAAEAQSTLPDPTPALGVPLETQAVNYYIRNYTTFDYSMPELMHDHSLSLQSHLDRAKPGSALHLTVSALSHAIFARARNVPDALIIGDKHYSQALAKCEYTLEHYSENDSGALLLATMLMATFEVLRLALL